MMEVVVGHFIQNELIGQIKIQMSKEKNELAAIYYFSNIEFKTLVTIDPPHYDRKSRFSQYITFPSRLYFFPHYTNNSQI